MRSHRLSSSSISVSPPPSPQPTVSAPSKSNRGEQIVQSAYGKFTHLILQSRIFPFSISKDRISVYPPQKTNNQKLNRWFNLETEEIDLFRTETRYWRNACVSDSSISPLVIEIYLDASELSSNQIVVLLDEFQQKHKIDLNVGGRFHHFSGAISSSKNTILLESWRLSLEGPRECDKELPVVYKHGIAFFRSLLTFIKTLPSSSLFNRLKRIKKTELKLGYRIVTKESLTSSEIGFDKDSSSIDSILSIGIQKLAPFETPLGSIKVSVISRRNCNFYLEDSDKLLSSKFQGALVGSDSNLNHYEYDGFYGAPESYNPDPRSETNSNLSRYADLQDSQTSSITSLGSGSLIKNIHSSTHNRSNSPVRPGGRDSVLKSRTLTQDQDILGSSKGSSERGVPSYVNMKSSPPSHMSMSSRRSPSITMFSPFKSPSLSSSPSINNASPPSRTSSFGKRTSGSLERGLYQPPRATPSPSIRPASPGHSKISSSFGQRFSTVSGSHPLSENSISKSLGRRTPSLRNLYTPDKLQSESSNENPETTISRASNEDLTEFMKLISNPPNLICSLNDHLPGPLSKCHDIVKEYKQTYIQLEELAITIESCFPKSRITDCDFVNSPVTSPLRQTGFKTEYSFSDNSELDVKTNPIHDRLITSREFVSAQNVSDKPKEVEVTSISSNISEKILPRTSLLSQKFSNQKNA